VYVPTPGIPENRTLVLEVPEAPEASNNGPHPRADTSPNLARSSQVMALGTLVSRITGFLCVFYAFRQNRAPAVIGMLMLAVGVIGDVVAFTVLPPSQVVIGLAAAYGLVTLTGATVAWPLQLRRVGSLDGRRIARSLVRMFLAALPGVAFAFAMMAVVGSVFPAPSALYGLLSVVCAKLLGIEEFSVLLRSLISRLGRLSSEIRPGQLRSPAC
jgi:putative peptidoglycan lipid II flippase